MEGGEPRAYQAARGGQYTRTIKECGGDPQELRVGAFSQKAECLEFAPPKLFFTKRKEL